MSDRHAADRDTNHETDGDRPLTARSVLASTLLGTDPPELPVARLVAVAQLFGVSENSARVALSRMAASGEVTHVDDRYRLAGHLLDRQARQRESRAPRLRAWDGTWTVVVVTSVRRDGAERLASRRALRAARLGELREGVWLRPANLPVTLPDAVAGTVERFSATPADDPAVLAGRLWDLEGWAHRADRLRSRMTATAPALVPGDTAVLAPGFVLSASVLRHLQADPLLPPRLLPRGWPADALRADYDTWDAAYRKVLRHYHRQASR